VTGKQKEIGPPTSSCRRLGFGPAAGENGIYCLSEKAVVENGAWPKIIALFLGLIFILEFRASAQNSSPTEYQIKAAFLYNFAKFVEWPPRVFASPTSPIIIDVLGENVFGDNLERTIHNKTVNHHPFRCEEIRSVNEATNCQILFISASEIHRLPKILKSLRGTNILTVSETDHFIEAGGMINFVIEDDEIHFQINDDAAKRAGLKISSKLLSLAVHNH